MFSSLCVRGAVVPAPVLMTGAGTFDSSPFVFLLQRLLLTFSPRNNWLFIGFDIAFAQTRYMCYQQAIKSRVCYSALVG